MAASDRRPEQRDIAYHLHPNTDVSAHETLGPHIITSGEGIFVQDSAGRTLIEGMSGLWCASLGFGERRLIDAACRQFETLSYNHNFAHRSSPVLIDLAEKLVGLAPAALTRAFFVGSGSEANETIVKILWHYNNVLGRPAKKKIIARRWAYHGSTIVASSLSGMPGMHRLYDLPVDRILHVDAPHFYGNGREGETEEQYADRLRRSWRTSSSPRARAPSPPSLPNPSWVRAAYSCRPGPISRRCRRSCTSTTFSSSWMR